MASRLAHLDCRMPVSTARISHRGKLGPDVVRDLQAEVERLRAEVKEFRQKTEDRSIGLGE